MHPSTSPAPVHRECHVVREGVGTSVSFRANIMWLGIQMKVGSCASDALIFALLQCDHGID